MICPVYASLDMLSMVAHKAGVRGMLEVKISAEDYATLYETLYYEAPPRGRAPSIEFFVDDCEETNTPLNVQRQEQ